MLSNPLFASQRAELVRALSRSVGMGPLDPTLNLCGDSMTANSIGVSGNNVTFENYGHGAHYTTLTGGRVRISAARKSATPGHTTKDWLDNMPTYLAAGGSFFLNRIGPNDRNLSNNFSLSRSKQFIATGIRMQIDAGKIPGFIGLIPRSDTNISADQQLIHMALREWILTRLPEMGVIVSDPWPFLAHPDPSLAAQGLPNENLLVDKLHENALGALLTAQTMAPNLIDLFPSPVVLLPEWDEPYDATYSKAGWLTANPLMLGTAGTKSGSANAVGEVANNWNVAGTNWTGGSVRCFKEAHPDGHGELQCFELGGTPTTAGSTLILEQVVNPANLAALDKIKGMARVAYENLSGVGGVSIDLRFVRGGTASFMKSLDRYAEGYQMEGRPRIGPQETPFLPVDMTETEIKLRTVIYGCQNVPIRGIVKVGQFASQKVL